MENAAKALLISAGVLIAILLLSLFTYLMRQMGGSTSSIYSNLSQHEITEFNQKFLNYEGRGINYTEDEYGNKIYNPLTIQDIVTLINLAKDTNMNGKYPTNVKIYRNFIAASNNITGNNYIELLNINKQNPPKFNCTKVNINQGTMLVDYVIIEKHNE